MPGKIGRLLRPLLCRAPRHRIWLGLTINDVSTTQRAETPRS
jgi:hypothetical protein